MEQASIRQEKSETLKNKEESNGTVKTGLSQKELIEKGQKWFQEKLEQGWMKTPFGMLPGNEIEKSGMIYGNGTFSIPTEEYMAEDNYGGHKKGEKYYAPSKQFMKWLEEFNFKRGKDKESYIESNMEEIGEVFNLQ